MNEIVRVLLAKALQLPLEERVRLAADLLASIDGEPAMDVEATWAAEIELRGTRALAGKSEGRPVREVA